MAGLIDEAAASIEPLDMNRRAILLGECGLLPRAIARRYCGGPGDERFDREVGAHVTPRLV